MGKILLFVSFVVTLLTAVLGFLNHGNAVKGTQQIQEDSTNLAKVHTDLETSTKKLKEETDNVAALQTSRDQTATELASTKTELDKAKSALTDAAADKTAVDADLTKTKADLASMTQQYNDLKSAQPSSTPVSNEAAAKAAEQETLITKLQQDLETAKTQLAALQTKEQARTSLKMQNNLEGRVLAVNPAWNFVVINLGDKNGVVNNAELLVKRGKLLVGKVRITSVEPSTSIADIVANSVPSGITITPNDQVIYQTVQE